MRLGETFQILKLQLPRLAFESEAHGNAFKLGKLNEVRSATIEIGRIKALSKAANALLGHLPIADKTSSATVTSQVKSGIESALTTLQRQGNLLLEALSEAVKEPTPNTVYLRLPETHNLNDLNKDIKTINDSFNQIFSGRLDSLNIRLEGFDVGTEWLVFSISPVTHIGIFLTVMNSAIYIARKFTAYQLEQLELEERQQEKTARDNFRSVTNTLLEGYAQSEAKRIVEKFKKDPNDASVTEDINRLTHALENLSGIFRRGGTVQVPIEAKTSAQEETKQLEEQTKLLDASVVPLLEHKKSE